MSITIYKDFHISTGSPFNPLLSPFAEDNPQPSETVFVGLPVHPLPMAPQVEGFKQLLNMINLLQPVVGFLNL